MKVLLLTNESQLDFFVDWFPDILPDQLEIAVKYTGEYDWSEDYDIGISFMYRYKVPAKEVNSHTWLNFHPAPLPEYKGRNLCYHAIMNGEKQFGASIHYMDENFDTGDIIRVVKFPVYPFHVADDISFLAMRLSKELFREYFPRIIAGEQFERLTNVGGTYYKKEAIDEAIDDSLYLTEWNKRRIRAITYGDFYPKVDVGGVTYKIVRDE